MLLFSSEALLARALLLLLGLTRLLFIFDLSEEGIFVLLWFSFFESEVSVIEVSLDALILSVIISDVGFSVSFKSSL